MVIGLGIDVTSVARIERALERFGERFRERVLTERERHLLRSRVADRAAALAGRFAAKEALSKALGGPNTVWWQHVEVLRGPSGAPELVLNGAALELATRLGVVRRHISITHDAGVAAAVVILER